METVNLYVLISDRVNHKPILVNKTNDLILEVNQSTELFCTFYSNYFKSVEWQFQKCEKFKENCTIAPTNVKVTVHFILFLHYISSCCMLYVLVFNKSACV